MRKRFADNRRLLRFELPFGTICRYVRVQLEGRGFMHFAAVEVLGSPGGSAVLGTVDFVSCGNATTIAIKSPVADEQYVLRLRPCHRCGDQ